MFNQAEIAMLNDALNMALQSNKRMQNSKPKFKEMFDIIENDLNALKLKINTLNTKDTPVAKK